jgi:hypothetical protein
MPPKRRNPAAAERALTFQSDTEFASAAVSNPYKLEAGEEVDVNDVTMYPEVGAVYKS